MPICLHALTNGQLNQHLEARGARTSGSRRQREERLQRFLDFENQKERRAQFVQQMREQKEEMDGQQDECCETCECNQARAQTEEERVARALLDLRDDAERSEYYINHLLPRVTVLEQAFTDLDESYEAVVAENLRLNNRLNNLETRLSHVENRSDSPPPLMFPESNPMWKLEEFHIY
jgi:chromosome segregation ATPase